MTTPAINNRSPRAQSTRTQSTEAQHTNEPAIQKEQVATLQQTCGTPAQAEALTDKYLGKGNGYLDDSEEDKILRALGATDAKSFQDIVENMPEAQLKRFCDSIGPEQRLTFLAMATGRGLVEETGGKQPKRPLDPPREPRLIKNDPKYPAPLRRLIHDENVARANAYEEKYGAYHARWQEAFRSAPTMAAKRLVGRPAPYAMPNAEPGFGGSDKLSTDMASDWVHRPRAAGHYDFETYDTVRRAVAKDQGHAVAGDFEIYVDAEAHVSFTDPASGMEVKGEVKGEITRSGDGEVDSKLDPTVSVGAHGVGFGVSTADGHLNGVKGEVDLGLLKGSVDLKTDKDGNLDGAVSATVAKVVRVGITEQGEVDVAAVAKVGTNALGGSVAVGARFNPTVDPKMLERALKDHGSFFDLPRELTDGVAWKDLPAERKIALHVVNGWTEKEWNQHQGLQKANVVPFRR